MVPSGPFWVSKTGAVGITKRELKCPMLTAHEIPEKVLVAINSRKIGHGSRNSLRSVYKLTCRSNSPEMDDRCSVELILGVKMIIENRYLHE